ncbi:pig-Y, phosphatidylinositol N-acetylglucosaminyltransferase subunit Eri1 [Schizosaccharomyces pombe]|uniref:Uncharacterized protein C227.19c n=1 Tax=Schizosaccharomyces pombe (strain 972 / ATCC 24843) TaxID=284812 RepID=YIDS_SCHPO|nr:uncharacterized protein SPAC227.19c [Schizosaccharomyces pombe]C6Y4B7.1 RecName: Full=Uncharacterized protein C227.19c [Schizosaccharomyces pombe 972h-]CBA11490.1 conserved protein [Schizosaccharomyces pombe]|eukprot:NP_001343065.1 uncharacterized protein SPAC227.19c [Schizosaccharomyces pombe]
MMGSMVSNGYLLLFTCWFLFVFGLMTIFNFVEIPLYVDGDVSPIRSYYPCILILTCTVVFFVWLFFNWLGLKYFRHSPSAMRR